MLNQLFSGSAGFSWGVRASGFVVLALLLGANILMSDNPEIARNTKAKPDIKSILTDLPYILSTIGYVILCHVRMTNSIDYTTVLSSSIGVFSSLVRICPSMWSRDDC